MRLLVAQQSLSHAIRWIQRILFAGAILMLGYCGFVLADSWMFQNRELRRLNHLLDDRPINAVAALHTSSTGTPQPVRPDGLVGRIEIDRLGVSVVVIEGTSRSTLRRAVGHISGTALPGRPGNVGISGHRDTFFRPLRNIRENDIITLTTLVSTYRYRVTSTTVVRPTKVAVLNPTGEEALTLVTCYPFYFVGPAPQRFIVHAVRIS